MTRPFKTLITSVFSFFILLGQVVTVFASPWQPSHTTNNTRSILESEVDGTVVADNNEEEESWGAFRNWSPRVPYGNHKNNNSDTTPTEQPDRDAMSPNGEPSDTKASTIPQPSGEHVKGQSVDRIDPRIPASARKK